VHNAICCTRNTCTAYVTFSCRRAHASRARDMCVNELHAPWVYDFCAIGCCGVDAIVCTRNTRAVNIIMRCSHFMRLCLTDSQRDEFIIALLSLSITLLCAAPLCSDRVSFPLENWTVGAGRACLIIIAFCWRKQRKQTVLEE
jgi:hypothetical protein